MYFETTLTLKFQHSDKNYLQNKSTVNCVSPAGKQQQTLSNKFIADTFNGWTKINCWYRSEYDDEEKRNIIKSGEYTAQ